MLLFYKEQKVLVEGPLSNLKESSTQLPKPKEMKNDDNPTAHFMRNRTINARDYYEPPKQPLPIALSSPYQHQPARKSSSTVAVVLLNVLC